MVARRGITTLRSLKQGRLPSAFPGIEQKPDDAEVYTPAPLRLQDDEDVTIEQQAKGSARHLLRDRNVDDGGYLQSRSPFYLKAPRWEDLDQDRPVMTKEGEIWEDLNHFVDYLTCKNTKLAHDLNEALAVESERLISECEMLCEVTQKSLCRHEILGKGYPFSREPVMSPSELVGQILLNKEVPGLCKGMEYLWILDKDYVEHQRYVVQGMDLARMRRSCLMLNDAFQFLHQSFGWNESSFVDVLKKWAVVFEDLGNSVYMLDGSFVLVNLALWNKRVVERYLEVQRMFEERLRTVEVLNEMGKESGFYLESDRLVFEAFIRAAAGFAGASELEEISVLGIGKSLYSVFQSMDLPAASFLGRVWCLDENIPDIVGGPFFSQSQSLVKDFIERSEEVVGRYRKLSSVDADLVKYCPALLLLDSAVVEDRLRSLREALKTQMPPSISDDITRTLLADHPEALGDIEEVRKSLNRVWPVASSAWNQINVAEDIGWSDLLKIFWKFGDVVHHLENNHGLGSEEIRFIVDRRLKQLREWTELRNENISREILDFLMNVSVEDVSKFLLLEDDWTYFEKSVFLLFGKDAAAVLKNLSFIPELLNSEDLNLALLAARCHKITRESILTKKPRSADAKFRLLFRTVKELQRDAGLDQEGALARLEEISDFGLLTESSSIEISPVLLSRLCSIFVKDGNSWENFLSLLGKVHHPLLAEVRPEVMANMRTEAFCTILKAPEVFLRADLYTRIVRVLTNEQWTFAGLDVETVEATEPCLFYYVIEQQWNNRFFRSARRLKNSKSSRYVRLRGKSIVDIRDDQSAATGSRGHSKERTESG